MLLAMLFTTQVVLAQEVTIGEIKYNLLENNEAKVASYQSTDLVEVDIPQSITVDDITYIVTSIGEYAFSRCSSMTSISIPEGVTSIGVSAFYGCSSLISINIPKGVTSIDTFTFYECSSLTSINIPESVTSIGYHTFRNCISLKSINIPEGVTSIGGNAFSGCSSLTSINIPESVTSIGENVFSNCSSLPVIDNIRYADTYLIEATDKSLSEYTISEGTRWIGEQAFQYCYNLESINIPISVRSIGYNAFRDCSYITDITLPDSLKSIGKESFFYCPIKSPLIIRTNNFIICGENAFSEKTFFHTILFVPYGMFDRYAYGSVWYKFINIKEYVNSPEQVSERQAYMLMNANGTDYTVYDGVNHKIGTMKANSSVDESNPNNSWMMLSSNGKDYLYNIGAGKFGTIDGGELKLTDKVSSVNVSQGEKAISIQGMKEEMYLVKNDNVAVKDGLDRQITTVLSKIADSRAINNQYGLDGRSNELPNKGFNIIRFDDGSAQKVFVR